MTLSIGSKKNVRWLKEISIFDLSTWNLYLRDITFVTDVSVATVETIKLVFKPIFFETVLFPETFGYLYDDFEIGGKGNIEGHERGCRQSLY